MLSYEEACLFLDNARKWGSILGLQNMHILMELLGNPQNDIPVIHIAGTNGKGSVGAYLASIFQEAGLKTGRYCSPAVFDPLECWQYDGNMISIEEYCQVLSQVKEACELAEQQYQVYPTVFEIETALAFVYFKQMQPDIVLLETGLGGAEDATNVIEHPLACVFTTISRDHMQFLGESLEEITKVKAGIIKKGALVFSAEQKPEVRKVLDCHMAEKNSSEKIIYVSSQNLKLLSQIPGMLSFTYKERMYQSKLSGIYQMQNAALAIEVADRMLDTITRSVSIILGVKSYKIEEKKQSGIIKSGVEKASWPGRFEIIGTDPLFILDGAHNEDAVKQLANTIENCFTNQSIALIIGILADKEHEKMLECMMPFAERVFTVTPPNSRGLDGRILAEEVSRWHEDVIFCDTLDEAVKSASAHGKERGCPILAFGSLSYLGELKKIAL